MDASCQDVKTLAHVVRDLKSYALSEGFDDLAVSDCDVSRAAPKFKSWLDKGYAGDMGYLQSRFNLRESPELLVDGVKRVITLRMNYAATRDPSMKGLEFLNNSEKGFISQYALGRDYHKVLRRQLKKVAQRLQDLVGSSQQYRVFTDSAPIMEVEFAEKSGLGWRGKHTLLINRSIGSFFFLGEIFTDLELPVDEQQEGHCGSCTRCIDVCPTGAIVAPYELDARKCISYLTIELKGVIPEKYRGAIGNRIYGCDDCQVVCPWNKYAQQTAVTDFMPRDHLDGRELIELFEWSKEEFERLTEGSAIRRIGYDRWLRNIACALGNAPTTSEVLSALHSRAEYPSEMVREHIIWAIEQHEQRKSLIE